MRSYLNPGVSIIKKPEQVFGLFLTKWFDETERHVVPTLKDDYLLRHCFFFHIAFDRGASAN